MKMTKLQARYVEGLERRGYKQCPVQRDPGVMAMTHAVRTSRVWVSRRGRLRVGERKDRARLMADDERRALLAPDAATGQPAGNDKAE